MIQHHQPQFLDFEQCPSLNFNGFAKEWAQAKYDLGLLEGSHKNLKNPSLLVSPLTAKEATVSSLIEGTVSTVSDVFTYEASGKGDSNTIQVANYRKAITDATRELEAGREITTHLIESLHLTLMQKVRDQGKPGKFREDIVYIAEKKSDSMEKALYIPPEPFMVRDYMQNLVNYLKESEDDPLIKTGLFHYQFEAIHPFDDGNGRLGRLIIPLILFSERIISTPILYISGFFDKYRDDYISALHKVDETGKFEEWLAFFLNAIAHQSAETQQLIDKIYILFDEIKNQFKNTKSPFIHRFIEFLFESPVFSIPQVQDTLGIQTNITVNKYLKIFIKKNLILDLKIKRGRAKLYLFKPLLDLLK